MWLPFLVSKLLTRKPFTYFPNLTNPLLTFLASRIKESHDQIMVMPKIWPLSSLLCAAADEIEITYIQDNLYARGYTKLHYTELINETEPDNQLAYLCSRMPKYTLNSCPLPVIVSLTASNGVLDWRFTICFFHVVFISQPCPLVLVDLPEKMSPWAG